jgi:hypothetical protein
MEDNKKLDINQPWADINVEQKIERMRAIIKYKDEQINRLAIKTSQLEFRLNRHQHDGNNVPVIALDNADNGFNNIGASACDNINNPWF